jgi:hypothetical protein
MNWIFVPTTVLACASQPAPVSDVASSQETSSAPPAAIIAPTALGGTNAVTGWFLSGNGPDHFNAAVDPEVKHGGRASARLRSVDDPMNTFGTLMQSIRADDYLGRRVRLSAFIRTNGVSDWAGLWLRVDQRSGVHTLDNMQNRPIRGTTDWTEHHVVLDVPTNTASLHFGVLQSGPGTTWLDDVRLAIVDSSVPTTNAGSPGSLGGHPTNLAFDD